MYRAWQSSAILWLLPCKHGDLLQRCGCFFFVCFFTLFLETWSRVRGFLFCGSHYLSALAPLLLFFLLFPSFPGGFWTEVLRSSAQPTLPLLPVPMLFPAGHRWFLLSVIPSLQCLGSHTQTHTVLFSKWKHSTYKTIFLDALVRVVGLLTLIDPLCSPHTLTLQCLEVTPAVLPLPLSAVQFNPSFLSVFLLCLIFH